MEREKKLEEDGSRSKDGLLDQDEDQAREGKETNKTDVNPLMEEGAETMTHRQKLKITKLERKKQQVGNRLCGSFLL